MQSSNAPNKISLPFAASGTKNTIPVPSQQGVTPGAASFTDGFPPLTFTPLSAGGVPPSGADFNGILNSITALQQWKSAGGQFPFDATFAAAIGGYPKGATVLKSDGTGLWISTAENNTTNPDTGGAGWLAFSASSVQSGAYNTASDTGTINAYSVNLSPAPSALTDGLQVVVSNILNTNNFSSTLNVNGLGARYITDQTFTTLGGGEIKAGNAYSFTFNAKNNTFTLNGRVPVILSRAGIALVSSDYGPIVCVDDGSVYVFSGSTYVRQIYPHGRQVFTSSGTFNPPLGVTTAYLTGCGAGGGGGGAANQSTNNIAGGGGGGGGAAFMISQQVTLTPGTPVTVTIGAAGAGAAAVGTNVSGNTGAAGGNTIWAPSSGTTITLNGGTGGGGCKPFTPWGGSNGPGVGGGGGAAQAGYTQTGNSGNSGIAGSAAGSVFPVPVGFGTGGGSPFGSGGQTNVWTWGANGSDATGYGAGGCGGQALQPTATSGNNGGGGNGTQGILIVEW